MTSYSHWERLIEAFPLVKVGGVSINVVKVSVRDEATGTPSLLKGVINIGIRVQHIGRLLIGFNMPNTYNGKVKQGLFVVCKQAIVCMPDPFVHT